MSYGFVKNKKFSKGWMLKSKNEITMRNKILKSSLLVNMIGRVKILNQGLRLVDRHVSLRLQNIYVCIHDIVFFSFFLLKYYIFRNITNLIQKKKYNYITV